MDFRPTGIINPVFLRSTNLEIHADRLFIFLLWNLQSFTVHILVCQLHSKWITWTVRSYQNLCMRILKFTACLQVGLIHEWKHTLLTPYVGKQVTALFHTQPLLKYLATALQLQW